MPKPLQFNTGALIYYAGEEANKIYILQSGKVSLVYTDIESGDNVRSPVQPGEFFGVKSALGRFPREENAIAMANNTTVIAFTIPEFEALAVSNTRIIFQMLKVFSNQLRRVHDQVARLTKSGSVEPDEGLFALGEKHLKNKRYAHAQYVFNRYLIHYPEGANAQKAEKNLQLAQAALGKRG